MSAPTLSNVHAMLARCAAESTRQHRHYCRLLEAITAVTKPTTLLYQLENLLTRRAEYKRSVRAVQAHDPQTLTVAENHSRHVEKQRLHQLHQRLRTQQQDIEQQHLPLHLQLAIDAVSAALQLLLADHEQSPPDNRRQSAEQLEAQINALLDQHLVLQQHLDWLHQWNARQLPVQPIRSHDDSEPEELGQLEQPHQQHTTVFLRATLPQSRHHRSQSQPPSQPLGGQRRIRRLMARNRKLKHEMQICLRKIVQTEQLLMSRPHHADLQARYNCMCIQYRQLQQSVLRSDEMVAEESGRLRVIDDQRLLCEAIESSIAGLAMAVPVELADGQRPTEGGSVPAVFAMERGDIVFYWHGVYVHVVNGAH